MLLWTTTSPWNVHFSIGPHHAPLARRLAEAMNHINMIPTKTCRYFCYFSLDSVVLNDSTIKKIRLKNLDQQHGESSTKQDISSTFPVATCAANGLHPGPAALLTLIPPCSFHLWCFLFSSWFHSIHPHRPGQMIPRIGRHALWIVPPWVGKGRVWDEIWLDRFPETETHFGYKPWFLKWMPWI